jgi:outer membrane receptor protein involved in Fe transport
MKNQLLLTTFFFLFVYYISAPAQERRISGVIKDANNGQPLKGANILLSASRTGTVSDEEGFFTLSISQPDPADSLVISFMGYKQYAVAFSGIKDYMQIRLEPVSLDYGEAIVIRAEREHIIRHDIPQSTTKIELAEIERYGSSEISDILKPLPAIRIEGNDLDGRRIQIRGSNSDEVNVYLDGVLINNLRFDNSADLSIVPVEHIDNLEILKGGNSTFLGNGAFGGVVNISTRQPKKSGLLFKGKIGSFKTEYLLGSVSLFFNKKIGLSYFGQLNSFSPEIEYFPDEKYSDKTSNQQISTRRQNHLLTLNYFTHDGQYLGRFISYFTDYQKPFWKNVYRNFLSIVSYTGDIFGSKDFSFNINHFYTHNEVNRQSEGNPEYTNIYKSNRLNFNMAKKYSYRRADIQLYAEYFHDDLRNDATITGPDFSSTLSDEFFYDNKVAGSAVFAFSDQLESLPNLSWKTYLGLRGDLIASGHQDVSPTFGAKLEYRTHPWEISPYLNYGKNVKYPTLIENAYIHDQYIITSTDTSSSQLKPEYSNSAELGLEISYDANNSTLNQLILSFEIFSRSSYNKLLNRPFDNELVFLQIGRNVTSGFEASLKFTELLRRIYLSFSVMDLHISNPLLYSFKPEKNLSCNLNYVSLFGVYLNSTLFYEGQSTAWYVDIENQLQTEKIDPFYDMDLSLGIKVPIRAMEVELQFAGYNILDNSGFTYYYLKKRYLQVSLSFRI